VAELYYLSDKAYNYLVDQAIAHNFVKDESVRRQGMSRFLEQLSFRNFTDCRPSGLKEYDQYMLDNRKTPNWANGLYPRRSRHINVDEDTKVRYGVVALEVKIYVDRWHVGGPVWNSPNSIVSCVLEAIGIKYLLPDRWPEAEVLTEGQLSEILSQE
jgi:hypothetical protein